MRPGELVLGRFRLPQEYVQSYALTANGLYEVTDRAGYNHLMERVLTAYRRVAEGMRRRRSRSSATPRLRRRTAAVTAAVEVAGPRTWSSSREATSRTASLALELDLNLDAANYPGRPVLLVVGGGARSVKQVLDAVHQVWMYVADHGCTVLGRG